jgi:hypothetical protein
VRKVAAVTGRDLRNAKPSLDETNRPAVSFSLNTDGARKFGKATGENIGRRLAIILDGRAVSPVIGASSTRAHLGRLHPAKSRTSSSCGRAPCHVADYLEADGRAASPSRSGRRDGTRRAALVAIFRAFQARRTPSRDGHQPRRAGDDVLFWRR